MRHRKKRLLVPALVALTAAGTAAALTLPATAAHADTETQLSQLNMFHQMVADTGSAANSGSGYLFLSEGTSSSGLFSAGPYATGIVVTDLQGNYVTSLHSSDGVEGLALSPDGSTLYAALAEQGEVAAIDVSTIQAGSTTATEQDYSLTTAGQAAGTMNVPYSLALQSGKLWVSYNVYSPSTGSAIGQSAIGDIDLSTGAFEPATAYGSWSYAPDLAADPEDTGVLAAVEPEVSPAPAATYRTSTGQATILDAQQKLGSASTAASQCDETQFAVTPGGSQLIAACGGPYSDDVYSTTNLSTPQAGSAINQSPTAVAVDATGTMALGTGQLSAYQPSGTLLKSVPLMGGDTLVPGSLALAETASGPEIFGLVNRAGNTSSRAVVTSAPTTLQPTMSLTASSGAQPGVPVGITLSFTWPADDLNVADTSLTITRTAPDGTKTTIDKVPPSDLGGLTIHDTPPGSGTYAYTATFTGGAYINGATATAKTTVSALVPSVSVSAPAATYNYEPTITVTGHLGDTHTNRTVSIYAETVGTTTKKLLKTGTVNSSGNLAVSYQAPHSTTFFTTFGGDAWYAAKTVSTTVGVRARVTTATTGYYGSLTYSGTTYRLYHRTGRVTVAATVAPGKAGQCVKLEYQRYYSKAWHAAGLTGCHTLNSSSKASGYIGVSGAVLGSSYRIRADYVRSSSDTSNLSNDSGWTYYIVRK